MRTTMLALLVAAVTGSVVAFFLHALDAVTLFRWQHPWLLWLLPASGCIIHVLYRLWGKNAARGNNLILEEIHRPGGGVPAAMTPLVLSTTLITHLFGGSAGREGTAVQMGGSLAAFLGRSLRLPAQEIRPLLLCGIAAGFGAVFGTPLTGALFALEVIAIGRIRYDALLPCLVASVAADQVCLAWGAHHTAYKVASTETEPVSQLLPGVVLIIKTAVAGALFGSVSAAFSYSVHRVGALGRRFLPRDWMLPLAGGILVLLLTAMLGTQDYLGLGVVTPTDTGVSLTSAFRTDGAGAFSWFWKLLFTAITLGSGFKGGEVTPLFFIGATLGNTLATLLNAPVDLMAGLGFLAVFAGAANTPLACTLMGIELFGADHAVLYAVACFTAYYCSGHHGIYSTQRVAVHKYAHRKH